MARSWRGRSACVSHLEASSALAMQVARSFAHSRSAEMLCCPEYDYTNVKLMGEV